MKIVRVALQSALLLFLPIQEEGLSAKSVNWPHPRGPQFDGVIDGSDLARKWPTEGPPVLWRRSLGQGYSGFAVADGRFYTQFQNSSGQHLACFDLDSGVEVWRTRFGLPWQLDGDWPGPYATPVYAEGHVYFSGCYAKVGCIRARDGKMLWSVDLQKRFAGKGTEFGYGCSPLVEAGNVILPVGGKNASVIALDAKSGKLIWKSGSDPASYCGSLAITVEGKRQIVSYLQNITVAHDPNTGAELWRHTRGHGYAEHAAWPIWVPPYLFYSEPFREGTQVLKLDYTNGQPRMTEVWNGDVLCNDIFSSVIVDGHIYGFDLLDYQAIHDGDSDGHFKCVELATGIEKWATTNTAHATVLTDRTNLFIFNELGEIILAEATPEEYRETSRARLFKDVQCWVSPAYYDGRLLVRAKTNVACVYLGEPGDERLATLQQASSNENLVEQPNVFDRHRSEAYFAPTLKDLNGWYWFGLIGVLLPMACLTLLLRNAIKPQVMIGVGMTAGGLAACPLYTEWFGHLVYTWPIALHAIYFAVLQVCVTARDDHSPRAAWKARGALLVLTGGCLLYHALCRNYFIVMGWGFIFGILPALPFTLLLQRAMITLTPRMMPTPLVVSWICSFSIFYWSAAVFIHLKT